MFPAAEEDIRMAPVPEWAAAVVADMEQFPAAVHVPVPPSNVADCPDKTVKPGRSPNVA
jgi:hypothetical protein